MRKGTVSLWVLRAIALIAAVSTLAQPTLAGLFLDGNVQAIWTHGTNGHILSGLFLAQAIAALVYLTRRGSAWPLIASILLLFASGMQIGFGYADLLAAHVPLGVAILGVQLWLTVWLWTPAAARGRKRRDRRTQHHPDHQDQQHDQQHDQEEPA